MRQNMNGRVDIIQPPDSHQLFDMQDKNLTKSTTYTDAVNGIYYDTILSDTYFSRENIQIVQNGIRVGVYKRSKDKFVIDEQNVDTLKIIMRSIFLQYAKHSPENIKEQVVELNNLVLNYAIPKVYSEALGYVHYCKDASTLVDPIMPPVMTRMNEKQLEEKPWL